MGNDVAMADSLHTYERFYVNLLQTPIQETLKFDTSSNMCHFHGQDIED